MITALSPRRKHEIAADNRAASGAEVAAFATSAGVMVNAIGGLLCGRTPALGNHYVDAGRLAAEKAAASHGSGVDFVSTNDVVLSRFGAAVGARVMLMPINWRGRLPNYSATDAGNQCIRQTTRLLQYLFACFPANDGLEISNHCRVRMRTSDSANNIKSVFDIGYPVTHGFVESVF